MDRKEIKDWLSTALISPKMDYMAVDTNYKCTLLCQNCMRSANKDAGLPPGGLGQTELTVETFAKLLKHYDRFMFNGQISDPIFNQDLELILKIMKAKIPREKMHLSSIHTAATAKHIKEDYYIKLFNANPDIRWIFGIDGLPGQSEKYRINQDSAFLMRMMILAAEYGVPTTWQWIAFSFNEDSIDQAKAIADTWGITLEIVASSRWFNPDDPRRPKHELYKGEYLNWNVKEDLNE